MRTTQLLARRLPILLAALAFGGALAHSPAAATLADHVTKSVLTLPETLAPAATNWGTWGTATFTPRLYLAPATTARNWVGWTDAGGDGHVSRVDDGSVAATDDFNGQPVAGLVAHGGDGYAVLLRDTAGGVMRLVKRVSGVTAWSTPLTSAIAAPTAAVGDSRLAYGSGTYAARFAVIGTATPYTGHYGEQGAFVNDSGVVQAGGWTWGASHAMCALAGVHGSTGQVVTLAVSDCYPNKGILSGTSRMLHVADGDCAGDVAVNLGQMADSADGWLVLFNGQRTASYMGYGVGLLRLDAALNASTAWLTNSIGTSERDPVLARLGTSVDANRYLFGWRNAVAGTFLLGILDATGTILQGPEDVTTAAIGWGTRDDAFRTAPDGSVRWLTGQGGAATLTLNTYTDWVSAAPQPMVAALVLHPPVPNPFNPSTVLAFELPAADSVTLTIHDLSGRTVRTLLSRAPREAGRHEVVFNGRDDDGRSLPAGAFICRLATGEATTSTRVTLLK